MGEGEAIARHGVAEKRRHLVLFDGHCVFCRAQMKNLLKLAGPDALEPRDFQVTGALDGFEGLTHADCMAAMIVVAPDGTRFVGAEAVARALMTRRGLGLLARAYYVPGLRGLADWLYRRVAARRYAIAGRTLAAGACESGSCRLHRRAGEAATDDGTGESAPK